MSSQYSGEGLTQAQCFDALRSQELQLKDLTPQQRSDACCRLALQFDPDGWQAIPDTFKEPEIIAKWLAHAHHPQKMLNGIATEFLTDTFYQYLIKFNPDIFTSGWKFDGKFVGTFSDKLLDSLLAKNPDSFKLLPDSRKSYSRSKKAIKANGRLLQYVPPTQVDAKLCKIAVKQCGCINLVPESLRTDKLMALAIGKAQLMSEQDVALIPKASFDQSLCRILGKNSIYHLKYFPQALITKALCLELMKGNEYMGFMLNEIAASIPEAIREEVMGEADFVYHVQPGELYGAGDNDNDNDINLFEFPESQNNPDPLDFFDPTIPIEPSAEEDEEFPRIPKD